jgi:hypothetical protein
MVMSAPFVDAAALDVREVVDGSLAAPVQLPWRLHSVTVTPETQQRFARIPTCNGRPKAQSA